jgi:hypothetical protein
MRKIYASPRMENLERVVAVMAEHGIATKIANRRVYEGSSYSNFSYARPGSSDHWPAVWVVRANDHARASQIMKEIGIEQRLTRYSDELAQYRARRRGERKRSLTAAWVRTAAIAALVIAVAVYAARTLHLG